MSPGLVSKRSRTRLSLVLRLVSSSKNPDSPKVRSVSSPRADPSMQSSAFSSEAATDHGPWHESDPPRRVATNTMLSAMKSPRPSMSAISLVPSPSRRPLSPSSTREQPSSAPLHLDPPVPPTANDLDAAEKARRLRNARKLSQILGEMPLGVVADENRMDGTKMAVRDAGAKKISKRLSWSAGPFQSASDISPPVPSLPPLHFLAMSPKAHHTTSSPPLSPVADVRNSSQMSRPSLDVSITSVATPSVPSDSGHDSVSNLLHPSASEPVRKRHTRTPRSDSQPIAIFSNIPTGELSEPRLTQLLSPRSHLSKDKWRRQSLDVSAVQARDSLDVDVPYSESVSSHQSTMKRSKSMWSRKSGRSEGSEEYPTTEESEEAFRLPGPLSPKQRALSVRRGRKLAQLFGSEPPPELYLVSPTAAGTHSLSPPIHDHRRDSIATFLSVASTDLLPVPLPRPSQHRSHSSISSVASEPSLPAPHPALNPSLSRKSESEHRPHIPFATDRRSNSSSSLRDSSDIDNSAAFRQRRLRAAKLSRFFGVAVTDLAQPLSMELPRPPSPLQTRRCMEPGTASKDVDVRIQQRAGFWGRLEEDAVGESDMNDVIAKLRQMKA